MNQSFFNRLIHVMQERPLEGKRILGLPPAALWELAFAGTVCLIFDYRGFNLPYFLILEEV
jgi:hypothetical protein